jgi:hypothetical protein
VRSLRGEQVDFYFYPFLKKLEEMDEDLEKRVIEMTTSGPVERSRLETVGVGCRV